MMLANIKDGTVMSSVPGLADTARVSLEATLRALEKFRSPDKWSSSTAHEGRRIVDIPGGWRLLNWETVKKARQKDGKKNYMRAYMADKRLDWTEDNSGNGHLPAPERISLEREMKDLKQELAGLEAGKPYSVGDPKVSRMSEVRVEIAKLRERLKLPT